MVGTTVLVRVAMMEGAVVLQGLNVLLIGGLVHVWGYTLVMASLISRFRVASPLLGIVASSSSGFFAHCVRDFLETRVLKIHLV